ARPSRGARPLHIVRRSKTPTTLRHTGEYPVGSRTTSAADRVIGRLPYLGRRSRSLRRVDAARPYRWSRRLLRSFKAAAEKQGRIHKLRSNPHASFVRQQRQSRVVRCGLIAAENNSGSLQAFPEEWCRGGLKIQGFRWTAKSSR